MYCPSFVSFFVAMLVETMVTSLFYSFLNFTNTIVFCLGLFLENARQSMYTAEFV